MWINKDAVLDKMRSENHGLNIVFQSIDTVLFLMDQ
jgi:hypothetical protein